MQWINRYQLFLFDFDGLLVDTERLHLEAYVEMCRARGFELTWNLSQFCRVSHAKALGTREALYAEFPALLESESSWEVLHQEKKEAYERLLRAGRLKLMPGSTCG